MISPERRYVPDASRPSQHSAILIVGPSVPSEPIFKTRSLCTASSPAAMLSVPLSMLSSCWAFIASFAGAEMLSVSSLIMRDASPSSSVVAPDYMPFLPFAVMFSVPVPHMVTCEPSLHLITAFSAFSLSEHSPERRYVPDASIVRCVPSISYPELSPVAVIALSVKVKAASAE